MLAAPFAWAAGRKGQLGESEFWRFSLSFYGDPEVAEACLRLQDEAGADVNMVLFLLWQASRGRRLSDAQIAMAEKATEGWRREVVVPLRGVRRWLKHEAGPVEPSAAHALRGQVKRIELEAERLQQEALAALAEKAAPGARAGSPADAAEASLAAYEAVHGQTLPPDVVGLLLDKLAARSDASPKNAAGGGNAG